MIVMTDGENTRSKSGSFHNGQSQVNADRKAADICNNIKDDNITVYTIAYEVNDTQTENLLRGCASNPDNYFDATNAGDLMEAFDVILTWPRILRGFFGLSPFFRSYFVN